jgi:drug/metabolite transporter (DMT)-like permease
VSTANSAGGSPGGAGAVPALFLTATVIWGSTWLAIKSQLGVVPAEVSVVYRFALASALLLGACLLAGRPLRLSPRHHAYVAAQGSLTFGFNYVAVYWAEQHVTSGLVAVVFSTVVFMTPIGMRLAFGTRLSPRTFVAATLGVAGVALLFLPELRQIGEGGSIASGVGWALFATALAASGNLFAVRNNRAGIGILPGTAWGMLYGALCAAATATVRGAPWLVDLRPSYVLSLGYLTVFGSIVAFLAYFTLLKRIGAGPSSYVGVSTPVLAMLFSTLFESYRWDAWALLGVVLAVAGNVLALRAPARKD